MASKKNSNIRRSRQPKPRAKRVTKPDQWRSEILRAEHLTARAIGTIITAAGSPNLTFDAVGILSALGTLRHVQSILVTTAEAVVGGVP